MNKYLTADLIDACLGEIQSGKMTIEECLASHPEVRLELRGLLETACAIPPLPAVAPDSAFRLRGRNALLASIARNQYSSRESGIERCWRLLAGAWQAPLAASRMGASLLVIALVSAITAGGGAVYASQEALPGEAFYQVKTVVEGLELALAPDDESKAKARLEHAAVRLAEIRRASQIGKVASADAAADALVRQVDEAEGYLVRLSSSGKDVSGLSELLADSLVRQQEVLSAVEARVPDKAKAAIAHAAEKSARALTMAPNRALNVPASPVPQVETAFPQTEVMVSVKGTPTAVSVGASSTPTASASIASTASPTFTQAISRVQNLTTDPKIPGQSFNGLLAKLQAARASLDRGQTHVALQVMGAFLGELNALEQSGHIGADGYRALYANYLDLVAVFEKTSNREGIPGKANPNPGQAKPAEIREKQPGKPATDDQIDQGNPRETGPRSGNGRSAKEELPSPTPTTSPVQSKPGTSPPAEGAFPKGKR